MNVILDTRCPFRAGKCAGMRKRGDYCVGHGRSGDFRRLLKLVGWPGYSRGAAGLKLACRSARHRGAAIHGCVSRHERTEAASHGRKKECTEQHDGLRLPHTVCILA